MHTFDCMHGRRVRPNFSYALYISLSLLLRPLQLHQSHLHAPLMQSSLKCGYYLRLFKSSASAHYKTHSELTSALVTHVQVPSVPLFLSRCCLPHPDHMLLIHCTIDISAHTLLKMWLLVLYCSHVSSCLRQVLSVMILLFTDT